jgi:hypothetical protein
VVLRERHLVDAGEQLLEVRLDDRRVLALAQDLQQVIVAQEVEAARVGRSVLGASREVDPSPHATN